MKNNHGNNQSNNQDKRNQKTNKKYYTRKPRHRNHSVLAKRTAIYQSFGMSDLQAKTLLPGRNNPSEKPHWNLKGFQLKKLWKLKGESETKTIEDVDNHNIKQSRFDQNAGQDGVKSGDKTESRKLNNHLMSDARVSETSLPNKQANSTGLNNTNRFSNKVSRLTRWSINPQISGAVAAILLFVMLVAAIIPATQNVRAEETETAALNPTMQLAKEYIYAGSRMLAIEDYGLSSTSTPTPTVTPTITPTPTETPTPTPTVTPTPSGGQGIVFDGTNYGLVTLPDAAPFNSLGGFQMIWRIRNAQIPEGTDLPGYVFSTDWFDLYAFESPDPNDNPSRFDAGIEPRTGDTLDGLYMIPTNFADSVCKLQYDPSNSRWTFETWKSDGTGYVLRTIIIQNISDYNLGGLVMGIGARNYETRPLKGKLDYWRWIQRVEPLGVFPSAEAPTGVTYLLDYEFEGNGNDSSGNGLNLTLTNNPTFENTP